MFLTFSVQAISIATSVMALVCLIVPILFKKELKGIHEKYYLIAFYLSAFVHFFIIERVHSDYSETYSLFKSISIVNGTLLPFLLSAFVCVRDRENTLLYSLVVIVLANLTTSFLQPHEVYLSVFFAFSSNVIGIIAITRNIKNKADVGLLICFVLFLCVLIFVLLKAPLHIDAIDFYNNFYFSLIIFIPGFICGVTIFILLRYVIEKNQQLAELAQRDPLTGLANRRFALELIEKSISYLIRKKSTYSVVMADIDRFKSVNDTYGHQAGDIVIVNFAKVISNEIRDYDISCRYGGEEFMLFLPDTDKQQAKNIASRIRIALKEKAIMFDGSAIAVTASFGIAGEKTEEKFSSVLNEADKALYQAKNDGRDKVVVN